LTPSAPHGQRKLEYTQEEVRVLKEIVAALTGNGWLSLLRVAQSVPVDCKPGQIVLAKVT